ncbi:CNB_1a_G0025420.mRNA.1.CDS.1 [Saccharomyces cerevisiae]|nr:CNB_1a_G0025420.mRNA.1.CDS.1 [Saccharomyces cerevisiae]CAI7342703.1 CNB_1a_G0025420.mRNA.1.CDS.1 [Saccharomyces cerevisiae]
MFNRFNKFQAAVALALLSRGALGDSYTNSTSSADLSSITSVSSASASATASDSLSSSDGTAVEVAAGGKLTLLDGEKYVFSSDLKVHGDLVVEKSEASYEGTAFDVSGETFEVSGNFSAEETGAVSASIYSFTPSSFKSSGDISLSLSKAKKGEVTFSPYSNAGTFSLSNAILNGGSVSGFIWFNPSTASTASTTSTASTASATSFTSGSASVYTTTLTYLNATSTVVVSCSETTDASGNITPLPQLSHAHLPLPPSHLVTKTDAMFQHQLLPTQLQPFPPSHTPLLLLLTVTTMAVTPRLSLLNVLKKLQQPPFLPKSYTTVTVTHCDDNGCNTKTVTSEASKQTSLATSTVTKSAAPTSHTAASSTFTGIVVQSEGMAAGLRTNALSTLAGIFILAFFLK